MVCVDKLACSELIEELGEESGVISMPSQVRLAEGRNKLSGNLS